MENLVSFWAGLLICEQACSVVMRRVGFEVRAFG
jgi:hypothetical protein